MRCNNCGYVNAPDTLNCLKCNHPLQQHETHLNSTPLAAPENPIAGTIKGSAVDADAWDSPVQGRSEPMKATIKGTDPEAWTESPLKGTVKGMPADQAAWDAPLQGKLGSEEKNISSTPFKGTIDPNRVSLDKPLQFTLQPVPREGEKEMQEITFKDQSVSLTREKLEKENETITSGEQAMIENIDGEWYIVDRSQLKTTYVRAGEPTKLKKGDILLMGNRKFIFDC